MLVVCLDTNAMGIQRPLRSNPHTHLLEACAAGQIDLCIPELVLDETMNLWRESAEALEQRWRADGRRLHGLGLLSEDETISDIDVGATVLAKRKELEEMLAQAGASIPELPAIDHRKVVDRALSRSQPFDSEGKDGYRDVLLWETVMDLVERGDEVLLVTEDTKAFHESKAERELSHSLAIEARARSGRPGSVRLVSTAREAVEEVLGKSEEAEARFLALMDSEEFADEFFKRVEWELHGFELGPDTMRGLLSTGRVLAAHISGVHEFRDVELRLARVSADGLLRVDFEVEAIATVQFEVPTEDYSAVAAAEGVDQWSISEDETALGEVWGSVIVLLEAAIDPPVALIERPVHKQLVEVAAEEVISVSTQ
jgi:hypothetical protein